MHRRQSVSVSLVGLDVALCQIKGSEVPVEDELRQQNHCLPLYNDIVLILTGFLCQRSMIATIAGSFLSLIWIRLNRIFSKQIPNFEEMPNLVEQLQRVNT